ncbi:hypothetical protein N5P18_01935 [Janibacter terrae]|uniref:Type II toxin-antitoxin system RelE/ParE family toxin n=1 Tax=Janibacter terrae TaxID=103817 RepID=A0ABZ2FL60_9MICO
MVRRSRVPRPTRSTEYTLIFGTRQAERGWRDLLATQRNAVVETWEFLTRTPQERVPRNHRLKAELSTVTHDGRTHEQWQHELTNGARIWFYVDESTVVLVDVHTRHPNQTK